MDVRPPRRRTRRRTPAVLAAATGLLLGLVPPSAAGASAPAPNPAANPAANPVANPVAQGDPDAQGEYVVALAQDPAARYDGSLPGLPRLRSATGGVDVTARSTQAYRELLLDEQAQLARSVGATPRQRYTVALNGFSARLSAAQVARLRATPGVLSVSPDVERHPTRSATAPTGATPTGASATDGAGAPGTTADQLGLTGPGGVWERLGGAERAGAGVVVADLDTGLWPEHPSVAGEPLPVAADGSTRFAKADGGTFTGACESGPGWTVQDCSTKVVGARTFSEGFEAAHGGFAAGEFRSPRDSDGHGTHTATTAAGRSGVPATIADTSYGEVTGIAPAAALAVYKVCWTADTGLNGCQTSDLVAAVDQAVADGVDVINHSIGSGAATDPADPVEIAFLSAASAGVFVAASAGNAGPAASSTDHASPWVTTVAASTSVLREGTVVLGDGTRFVGARLRQRALAPRFIVLAAWVKEPGAAAAAARTCEAGTLDPERAAGKIVVCERSATPRVAKSAEVARAGGAGAVLVNTEPGSTEPDAHSVPTVHLDAAAGRRLVAAVGRTPRATARFEAGNTTGRPTPVPQLAGFSSRGPVAVAGGDVLKPDVAAPGSGIVAGYSPVASRTGRDLFAPQSGTSMAAPHVAGLAALVRTAHPDWSPAVVRSALTTTARSLVGPDGEPLQDVFGAGAGVVDPPRLLEPGLVYDSTPVDWLRWLEGAGVPTGTGVGAIDPSELNQASIAAGDVVGERTFTRRVTATTGGYYRADASVPGWDVRVTPSVLHLEAGQTKQFRVSATRTDAALEQWSAGELVWTGGDELTVRSPVALRAQAVDAPAAVDGTGAAGELPVTLTAGSGGSLDLRTTGFAPGAANADSIEEGYATTWTITVPDDAVASRFELTADPAAAGTDLDLYLFTADGDLVGSSATLDARERVDLVAAPGDYEIVVDAPATAGGLPVDYELTTFVLTPADAEGSLSAAPDPLPVRRGGSATYEVAWSGLDPRQRWLGAVGYAGSPALTLVGVG
ncbi:S8 family serine peptidase [Kineococcus sp. T13]|uniref:S8 family serine peptidase n=1 Tax=Kineococcus vitellinus TaxID=2696565 RepID=UPI001411C3DD|nr:S8 family serine peptidase [Kineococcus vitellinus]